MKWDRRRILMCSLAASCSPATSEVDGPARDNISKFPAVSDGNCHDRRAKLYNECVPQTLVFSQALQEADRTGKVVLVSFGAEWCIWCHVFDAYVQGQTGKFRYEFDGAEAVLTERKGDTVLADAEALNTFVSNNFVLAHIESDHAPDGWSVLEQAGADTHFDDSIPFVFTVDRDGRFAATFRHDEVEVRRDGIVDWYRGYDRRALLDALTKMHAAAS